MVRITPKDAQGMMDAYAKVYAPKEESNTDIYSMSKDELEDYGRTIGIELDRRLNKKKLIKQLQEHIDNQ